MNILYVSQVYSAKPTHAAVVTTYEIVKRLAERGHKVTILVPNFDHDRRIRSATNKLTVYNNVDIVAFTSLPDNILQKNLLSYGLACTAWYAPLLVKALRRTNLDVIISMYHPSHLATLSSYVLSKFLKLPLIVKVHDLLPDLTDPNFLRRTHKKTIFKLNLAFLRKSDFVLVQSTEWLDLATRVYGVNAKKIILFPTGVDVNKFNPEIASSDIRKTLGLEDKRILLFTGQISRDRGLDRLIAAMPKIVKEEPDVRFIVIGKGPEKSRLFDLSKHLNVDKFILFLGEVSHESIPEYVSLADVAIGPLTVLPITVGTIPKKVLEYLACGKPVVACHGGVSKDLVIDGYNGVLVDPLNVDELSLAIIRLLKDRKLAKRLGENARRHVESSYDWSAIETLNKVLENVCSK